MPGTSKIRNALLCATIVGLVSGCSLIPDMTTPAMPVAKTWPQGPAYDSSKTKPQEDIADLGWNAVFQSPQLQHLITTAVQNNRDLRIAALRVESARAAYQITESDLYPQINGTGSRTRSRTPAELSSSGRAITASQYSVGVGVTAFELDFFGRLRSLETQALEAFLATKEAQIDAQIALVAEVANAWLTLQADNRQLRLTKETLASRQASLDLTTARFRNGVATQLDIAQARTALETARVNLAMYTRAVAQDRNALEILVCTPLQDADVADLDAPFTDVVTVPEIGVSSEVLLRRPDIREAEHQLRAANANIGAARAAFFPSISLTGNLGVASTKLGSLFEGASRSWSFGPEISVPIFTAGRNQANLDVAKADRDIAVATYEKAIQTAFKEVANALAARKTMIDQLDAQKNLVASSQDSLDLSQARYDRGISSYLDVLDSQRSLYSAQQTQIDLERAQLTNLVGLYKALGGGITSSDAP
ncbi:MAG: efflux transporter outer membrane subunit [Rhodospirillaceae bacterium]|nr:efflux transporter outer membrane subunit [Rhodospirillaceae bacterium]